MEPQNTTGQSNKKAGIVISVIVALVLISVIAYAERGSIDTDGDENSPVVQTPSTTVPTTTPPVSAVPADVPKNTASVYKDGSYTATGTYMSPGGQDQISVMITLKNDIITDATVATVVADRTSQGYQNRFISGYKQYVIGKNIADVNLTKVSGSSLTPKGFNDALAQIKVQAKA